MKRPSCQARARAGPQDRPCIGSFIDAAEEIGGTGGHRSFGSGRTVGGSDDVEPVIGNLDRGSGSGRFPDGPSFGQRFCWNDSAACGHRQVGYRASTGSTGIAMIDRFGLQIQFSDPHPRRTAWESRPWKGRQRQRKPVTLGCVNSDGLSSEADSNSMLRRVREFHRFLRLQAEKPVSGLWKVLAREFVGQSLRRQFTLIDAPCHRDDAVFQFRHAVVDDRLGKTGLRSWKINASSCRQHGRTNQQRHQGRRANNDRRIHNHGVGP